MLTTWNDKHRAFKSLERMPSKSQFDASGVTRDGRECAIELKVRNAQLTSDNLVSSSTFQDDNLYIETDKAGTLYINYIVSGLTPIYINFLSNAVVVHNLLSINGYKDFSKQKIVSQGYGAVQVCPRLGLYLSDAAIYKSTNSQGNDK